MKRATKKNHVPLIIEPHPEDYDGYPFITLIQYRDKHMLTVVDNATEKQIGAFVLDMCGPEGLNEELIVGIVAEWYETSSDIFPLSIEFSRRGISEELSKIYKTYNIDFVTRVIGPLPKFNMTETKSIKRRKKKSVPHGVKVEFHRIMEF
jgi:hypothetical protein